VVSSNRTLYQLLSIKYTFSSPQLQAKNKLQTCTKFLFICVALADKLSLMNTSLVKNIFIINEAICRITDLVQAQHSEVQTACAVEYNMAVQMVETSLDLFQIPQLHSTKWLRQILTKHYYN